MKRWCMLFLVGLFAVLGLNCLGKGEKDDSPVVARVNDSKLTLDQLRRQIPPEYLKNIGASEKRAYVEQWIRQQLLYQLALKEKIDDDTEIRHRLRQLEQQILSDEILQRKLGAGTQVSDEEAKKYYDTHTDSYMREEVEVRISHIVVSNPGLTQDIRRRLQEGESFAKLAKEFSEDQTAQSGGDLGYFSESDMNDEITRTAFKLKTGQVSQPIRTPFGYHLVTVTNRQEVGSIRTFEEVKQDIVNNMVLDKQKNQTAQLLKDLEKEAEIETHQELLDQL